MTKRFTARLSAKARVAIPKPVRDRLGVGPGDFVVFEVGDGGVTLRALQSTARDDPFAVCHKWSSPADEDACKHL